MKQTCFVLNVKVKDALLTALIIGFILLIPFYLNIGRYIGTFLRAPNILAGLAPLSRWY